MLFWLLIVFHFFTCSSSFLIPSCSLVPDLFEEVLPDMTNISEYTYESLVFSFLLIGAVGNLMSDEPESKRESAPIVN